MEHMFQINDSVYKVFETGIASTSIENIEMLKNADEFVIAQLAEQSDITFRSNDSIYESLKSTDKWCGNRGREEKSSNGSQRTVFKLNLIHGLNYWGTYRSARVEYWIRPYKRTWGVWFFCSRTISWDIDVSIFCRTSTGWKTKQQRDIGTKSTSLIWYNMANVVAAEPRGEFYYNYYKAWAKTPSTDYVIIECIK